MKRHRVAIVGAGVMGRRHARVLSASPRFEVAGVLDLDARAAASVSEAWGIPPFASELELLLEVDAVIVATPIAAHASSVRRALMAGKHVLVEKPLAGRAAEARALLGAAEHADRRLFVGHSERFNPAVRALVAAVAPEEVLAIELRRIGAASHAAREHGALLNLGVHDLDLVAYLTRSAVTLRHAIGRIAPGASVEQTAHVLARTASGAAGHVFVDQQGGERRRTIALTTKRSVFHGDLLTPRLVCTCRETGLREELLLDHDEPLAAQADAFADALDGRPSAIATGLDGARAVLCAERASAWIRDAARSREPASRGVSAVAAVAAAEKL